MLPQAIVFGCPNCDREFVSRQLVTAHRQTCNVPQRLIHPCPYCGQDFISRAGRSSHIRTAHLPVPNPLWQSRGDETPRTCPRCHKAMLMRHDEAGDWEGFCLAHGSFSVVPRPPTEQERTEKRITERQMATRACRYCGVHFGASGLVPHEQHCAMRTGVA